MNSELSSSCVCVISFFFSFEWGAGTTRKMMEKKTCKNRCHRKRWWHGWMRKCLLLVWFIYDGKRWGPEVSTHEGDISAWIDRGGHVEEGTCISVYREKKKIALRRGENFKCIWINLNSFFSPMMRHVCGIMSMCVRKENRRVFWIQNILQKPFICLKFLLQIFMSTMLF